MNSNDSTNAPFALLARTDTGIAEALIPRINGVVRFCHDTRTWLVWNGRLWVADEGAVIQAVLYHLRNLFEMSTDPEDAKVIKKAENHGKLRSMLNILETFPAIRVSANELDANKDLLNTPSGVVNLPTGQIFAPSPTMNLTKQTRMPIDPNATCPRWQSFLERTLPDPVLRGFMQRATGSTISGRANEHVVIVLVGDGRNGKSVFVDTLTHVLGDYAGHAPKSILVKARHDRHSTDFMPLLGVRMAVLVEFPSDWSLDSAALKALSGGDPITARFCGKDNVTFSPTHQLWIATNHLPVELESSPALRSRLIVVPFNVTIPEAERDKDLTMKLRQEGPGILRWAVEGFLEWQREGLAVPDCIRRATAKEFEERDIVGAFISDRLVFGPDLRLTRSMLRDNMSAWADQNSVTFSEQRHLTELYRRLAKAGATQGKVNGVRHYDGVGLSPAMLTPLRVVNGNE